jgi:hypothetical protein
MEPMRSRRRPLSPGFLIAVLPAVAAALMTVQSLGVGRRAAGLGMAVLIGVLVLFTIGLPIDLAVGALRRRRDRARLGSGRRAT